MNQEVEAGIQPTRMPGIEAFEGPAYPAADGDPGRGLRNLGLDGPADVVGTARPRGEAPRALGRRHRPDVALPPLRVHDGEIDRPLTRRPSSRRSETTQPLLSTEPARAT